MDHRKDIEAIGELEDSGIDSGEAYPSVSRLVFMLSRVAALLSLHYPIAFIPANVLPMN